MWTLFDALLVYYPNNGCRSLTAVKARLVPLRATFGEDKALQVTASRIADYVQVRLAAKKAPATINRELAALRRAFSIAVEQERLSSAPRIKLLAEHNARQGFVNPADFEAIVDALPRDLQDVARFAYSVGWRKTEILTLKWADVDRDGQRITLRREHSKNRQPRTIPFVGALADLIERRWQARTFTRRDGTTGLAEHVFHRRGKPIRGFRDAWQKACTAAGHPGLLFHDLRRSAVRNLTAAGVDQAVAMRITGHKTVSVFQRYRIVADDDVRAALERTEQANQAAPRRNVVALTR